MTVVLHPNQFQVNEAWIVFRLNDKPIETERDGPFYCLALMDAASCFILGMELLTIESRELSERSARRLLEQGRSHKQQLPRTLFVPRELQVAETLAREAEEQEIEVVRVSEGELLVFTEEARESFSQHFGA